MVGTHKIVRINGHYEAYDDRGRFISSGDTYEECYDDLIDMIVAEARRGNNMENIREAVAV